MCDDMCEEACGSICCCPCLVLCLPFIYMYDHVLHAARAQADRNTCSALRKNYYKSNKRKCTVKLYFKPLMV